MTGTTGDRGSATTTASLPPNVDSSPRFPLTQVDESSRTRSFSYGAHSSYVLIGYDPALRVESERDFDADTLQEELAYTRRPTLKTESRV